jgi:dienelactone hydrolase
MHFRPLALFLLLLLAEKTHAQARDVQIRASDGQVLQATHFSPGKPGPAALLFRNCDGDRTSLVEFANRLRARGVHVLTYDYRNGLSAGNSWSETRRGDMEAAHDWLAAQPGVNAKLLVGVGGSCGVALALDFAMRYESAVRGIVVLSGPSSPGQRVFLERAGWLPVLGASSKREGAPENIDDIVNASHNAESHRLLLEGAAHGTEILSDSATEQTILDWISRRFAVAASPSH